MCAGVIGWVDFGVILWVWVVGGPDLADALGMNGWLGQVGLGQMGQMGHSGGWDQRGWDQLVRSMRGAIEDRSHVVHLGIGLGVVLVVWINWKLAQWILGHFESPKQGM